MAHSNAQELIAPLREDPSLSAIALDVDGTIAPIVARPEEASVPFDIRELLLRLEAEFGVIACVSGRRAEDARRVVGIDSLEYIGNHGLERLRSGASQAEAELPSDVHRDQVRSFAAESYTPALQAMGVRLEDKDPIWSFHSREADDDGSATAALEEVATAAKSTGFAVHWGRKVLEIRPSLSFDKGAALARLLDEGDFHRALYAGDDVTDLDCFRKLRELRSSGRLSYAVCIGVDSDEGPAEIAAEADLTVDGPEGMRELLAALL